MELHLILLFMIFASILAVEMRDLISSVIALSGVGLSVSLAFLLLKAPNLAVTQLVVEIICVIILIRGTIKRDLPLVIAGRWIFNTISTLLFIGCFLVFAFFALRELPHFGSPALRSSAGYLADGLNKTGSANIVTAITMNFRSYDAVAEAAILFSAIIGVLAITRRVGKMHGR